MTARTLPAAPVPSGAPTAPSGRTCAQCRGPMPPARASRRYRYCSDDCALVGRTEKKDARCDDHTARHHAWCVWNTRLLRAGVPEATRRAALAPLRDRGALTPAEARLRILAGGWRLTPGDRVEPAEPGVAPEDPWSRPSPEAPYVAHALALSLDPPASLPLARTRLLHGALTAVTDLPHAPVGRWSLVPHDAGCGWAALFYDGALAARLCGTRHAVRIGRAAHQLAMSATLHHLRAPRPRPPGRYTVTVTTRRDADNGLVWSSHRHTRVTREPTLDTLFGSLERVAAVVLGPSACTRKAMVGDALRVDLAPVDVRVGGHWGRGSRADVIEGVVGTFTVECNAVAAWLFECAAWLGLGGATAIGLGRVDVSVR